MEKRDEFNRLLRDSKRGKIDRIITKSVSRFARNTEELLATLRMLKEFGVSVYFEEQGIDTEKLNMEMLVTFPGMVAQQESETISGNVRWGIKKRMHSGDYICSHPPYGYILENGQLVVHETESVVVKRIYNLYLQGMSMQKIADLLNSENIPRPKRKGQDKWQIVTIRYILRNERYTGDALLQKTYMTENFPYKQRLNKGEKEMYYVENYNPPIISRDIFDKVQELIKDKQNQQGEKKQYILTKMMKCSECGRVFRRQNVNGKFYWICALNATTGKCKSRRVRENMVYETFIATTYKLKANREILLEKLIQSLEYLQNRTSENMERIRQIDKEIADLSAKNLVITRLHTSGVLEIAEYTMQTSEIGNKITELRIERKRKLAEDENDIFLAELKDLNEIIEEYQPNGKFNEELFERIVEKIVVNDNTRLTFHLIGGLTLTENIKEKGRCRCI